MTRALFTTWGRNISSGSEEIAHHVHSAASAGPRSPRWAGCSLAAGLLGVLDDEVRDSLNEGVGQPLLDRCLPPGEILSRRWAGRLRTVSATAEQSFGRVGAAVEHDIFDPLAQLRRDVVVDRRVARRSRCPCPSRRGWRGRGRPEWIASRTGSLPRKAKRDVADAAAHQRVRKLRLDRAGGLDV